MRDTVKKKRVNYYPFGLQHKGYNFTTNGRVHPYGYADKELEKDLGLNTIAYGQRDYDPAIARFTKIDRFTEKYRNETPYHFTKNNPILYREIQGDSVWVFTERTAGVGRHAFLRVKTDNVDKIVELWGPAEGSRTGRPRVDDFDQNGYTNGRSGVSDPFLIEPSSSNENNEFENSILEFAAFFQEQTTDENGNQDFGNLPNYDFTGPNSNGFVVSLVANADGGVKLRLPFNAIGQKETKAYDLAITGYALTQIRDQLCTSGTCNEETLSNLDALIQRNQEQQEQNRDDQQE
ncbi:RHS repeat-associated core domain-containing protein [Aquimarina macrocephali]|uniref:RHS repeat-associated core domain-containing protein n=1 Tax=Aquimarina macrocephali TaxID=666563 RepID=UPI003F662AD2